MKIDRSNKKLFDQYLSARNDFLNGKYKLAVHKLLPLELVNKNDDVNQLLVKSFYQQKDYRNAERFLLENINSYTSSYGLVKFMVNVLLKNNEFIMCREIIASFNNDSLKRSLLTLVQQRERYEEHDRLNDVKKIAKKFYHLSNVNLIRQRKILRDARRLPLRTFIQCAEGLLVDPFLAPIMRLSVLEILLKVGLIKKLKYRWIDQRVYLINLDKLSDLASNDIYQRVMKIIKKTYFHNPERMIALEQNLRLDLSYLYPFIDDHVTDPRLWVKIGALRLQGKQPVFTNDKIKAVYIWQVKLNRLTKNLVK